MLLQTNEDDLREFSGETPNMQKDDRPFHMGGKPIVNTTERGMLDSPVNKTATATVSSARTQD